MYQLPFTGFTYLVYLAVGGALAVAGLINRLLGLRRRA